MCLYVYSNRIYSKSSDFKIPSWPNSHEYGNCRFSITRSWIIISLAKRIFAVEGATAVFLGPDFVTITKSEDADWDHIKPALLGAIMEHFQSGQPVIEGEDNSGGHAEHSGEDSDIVNQIKDLLDTRVRPAVAQDGGDITFHGFERGVVYLHMQGACAGCPSSTITLKMGIENLLRHYIPEVTEVRPVAA